MDSCFNGVQSRDKNLLLTLAPYIATHTYKTCVTYAYLRNSHKTVSVLVSAADVNTQNENAFRCKQIDSTAEFQDPIQGCTEKKIDICALCVCVYVCNYARNPQVSKLCW